MTQEELRKRTLEYLAKHPVSITGLAKHIGIHYMTITNFLNGRRRLYCRTWKILEDFIYSVTN